MKTILFSPLPPPNGGMATWTKIYQKTDFYRENDVYLLNSAFRGKSVGDFHKFHFLSEARRTLAILYRVCTVKQEYRLVHYCCPCNEIGLYRDYINILLFKSKGTKVVLHCHCEIENMIGRSVNVFKKIVKLCDRIICITDNSTKYVEEIEHGKAVYIPNFSYFDKETSTRAVINKTINRVVFIGHVTREKGINELIELAKKEKDISFDIIGFKDKEYLAPSNVFFLGNIEHSKVLERLEQYDLLILPSYSEGFPNVILEAMSFGLPVIATKVGAIPNILNQQKELLCNVKDVNDLIRAFEISKDYEKRREISDKNYREFSNYFYNRIMNKYIEVYSSLIKDII